MNVMLRTCRKAAGCIVLLLLAGCEPAEEPTLRVGLLVWPAYDMAPLAARLGYYDEANIELVDYGVPVEANDAYVRGEVDMIATVVPYVTEIERQRPGQKIVMGIDFSDGGDALVARSDIRSLGELEGKRIGYEASELGAFMLNRVLDHAGLGLDDIDLVPVDTINQLDAFRNGLVDAVVTYEPTVSLLVNEGARVLFDSSRIPGEIIDVLLISEQTLASKRELANTFVDGWLDAVDYFERQPQEAARMIAKRQGLSVDEFLDSFDGIQLLGRKENAELFSNEASHLRSVLGRHQQLLLAQGILESPVDLSALPDDSLIPED